MSRLILSVLTHSLLLRPIGRRVVAAVVGADALLLETGDYLLLETGDKLLLE
jgi:hypothetical protein